MFICWSLNFESNYVTLFKVFGFETPLEETWIASFFSFQIATPTFIRINFKNFIYLFRKRLFFIFFYLFFFELFICTQNHLGFKKEKKKFIKKWLRISIEMTHFFIISKSNFIKEE